MSVREKVRELGARVKHNQKFIDQEREKNKKLGARRKEIDEVPDRKRLDFWCKECQLDYSAVGHKHEDKDMCAVYIGQCMSGHKNVRYITDVNTDPYFDRSHKVRAERELYADLMLTPDDPRFKTVYRKQWLEIEAQREKNEHGNTTKS